MAQVFSTLLHHCKQLLRGVGQVFFLQNALSGLLLLIGIGINSLPMLLSAILGAITSTYTAMLLKYDRTEIERGLYGFNGTLVGIAVLLFYGLSLFSLATVAIGAMVTTPLAHLLNHRCRIPAYTFPFVATVWAILLLTRAGILPPLPLTGQETALPAERLDLLSSLDYDLGQVMFQADSLLTGLLFMLAIVIASRDLALYTIVGVASSLVVTLFDLFPTAEINAGLYGYNAVLVAMAVGDKSARGLLKIVVGVLLTIALQFAGIRLGVTTLTAPFVFATWLVLIASHLVATKKQA